MTHDATPSASWSQPACSGPGFPQETIDRGIELGADVIAVDGGSTDSGPYYLGSSTPRPPRPRSPATCGSCSGGGRRRDPAHRRVVRHQRHRRRRRLGRRDRAGILAEEGLSMRVARIYSEQRAADLKEPLDAGRIHPLPPLGDLDATTLEGCRHIVGNDGPRADRRGARGRGPGGAGRAGHGHGRTRPPSRSWGCPPGRPGTRRRSSSAAGSARPTRAPAGFSPPSTPTGFTIEPLAADAACTPTSVAAHMLYETVNPFAMREPAGTLDVPMPLHARSTSGG